MIHFCVAVLRTRCVVTCCVGIEHAHQSHAVDVASDDLRDLFASLGFHFHPMDDHEKLDSRNWRMIFIRWTACIEEKKPCRCCSKATFLIVAVTTTVVSRAFANQCCH